jgi:hypothetical protein
MYAQEQVAQYASISYEKGLVGVIDEETQDIEVR